jgi:hypothetical protein
MNITGITALTEAIIATLKELGAVSTLLSYSLLTHLHPKRVMAHGVRYEESEKWQREI